MAAWAILGGAAITAGSNIIAGDKQSDAYGSATGEEQRQFDLQWDAQAPYRVAGENALTNMALLTGSPDPRTQQLEQDLYAIGADFIAREKTDNAGWFGVLAEGMGKSPDEVTPDDVVNWMAAGGDMGSGWNDQFGDAQKQVMQMSMELGQLQAQPTPVY